MGSSDLPKRGDAFASQHGQLLIASMSDSINAFDNFLAAFAGSAKATGKMRFDQFMELALYGPEFGYYRSKRERIGFRDGSDFFTSTTSSPVFGELVAAACTSLLAPRLPAEYTFVEIGAESSQGIFERVNHPFGSIRTVRLGEPLDVSGNCVVFSNELFDAQPFRRFVARDGSWREYGVELRGNSLAQVELENEVPTELPSGLPDGYVIDAPFAAASLAGRIAAQPWSGLFVACDYGKSWRELTEACPAGTARAFFRHQQSNDLLARPGQQDLTCHVCWDWLVGNLTSQGFSSPKLVSQESFFIRNAGEHIASITAAEASGFSRRKASLLQLIHPAHLGQKFQVLHASRG